jgi:hypothetical protein
MAGKIRSDNKKQSDNEKSNEKCKRSNKKRIKSKYYNWHVNIYTNFSGIYCTTRAGKN